MDALLLRGGVFGEDFDAVLGFELPNEPRVPKIDISAFIF